MTIFSILNSLLYTKKPLSINVDDENIFNLYMINRWCSMYSPGINNLIDDTTNKYGQAFDSKDDQLSFLMNIIPSCRFKKINYVKKVKKEKPNKEQEEQEKNIGLIAKAREISKREVEQYFKQYN